MIHRLGGVVSLVLCACGPGAKDPAPPEVAAPKPLCVDPAAPGGAELTLSYDEQPGLVAGEEEAAIEAHLEDHRFAMAAVEDAGATYALTIAEGCTSSGACDPEVVKIVDGKIVETTSLPAADTIPAAGDYPFMPEWMVAQDIDGDGTSEIWLSYNIVGEAEPGVGSTTRSHVAVYAPDDLQVLFHAVHSTSPEADVLERCTATLTAVDADCDGDVDLVEAQTCELGGEEPTVTHVVHDGSAGGEFLERD